MPRYEWEGVDVAGASRSGRLEAPTPNEAVSLLARQGVSVRRIVAAGAVPVAAPSQRVPTPATPPRPVAAPAPRVAGVVRTRRVSPKELAFLFTQLAQMLGAGLGSTDALTHAGGRSFSGPLTRALHQAAQDTAAGASLADAFARFPDVFPPSAVGSVRAGESGGYLPQACEALSEQFTAERKARGALRIFRWALVPGLFFIALVPALLQGLDRSFRDLSGLGGLGAGVADAFASPWGLVALGLVGVYVATVVWARGTERRRLRHTLGLRVPVAGRRARAEGAATFAWHLSRLGRSGIAPYRAWELAAWTVPNLALAEALARSGGGAREDTKLSELFARSGALSPELMGLVQTGEVSGQVPDSLDQIAQYSSADFRQAERTGRFSLYGLYLVVFMALGIWAGVTFYTGLFNAIYRNTVGETEEGW